MKMVIIILGIVLLGLLLFLQYKTNFYWKMIRQYKWRALQPHLQEIRKIHDRTVGKGKKISWFEKNVFKSVKKDFDIHKNMYVEYAEFCKSKNFELSTQEIEVEELINDTEYSLLKPSEVLIKELQNVQKNYDEVYISVNEKGEQLFKQRQDALFIIDKIEDLINGIASYPKSFEIDINTINIQKSQFKDTVEYGIEQRDILIKSAKSAGAGIAAGTAVVSIAPTVAMWVATTFGTASTGTAISALSGAAATNAALAWLGGGTLAAGGGGMIAGHALLALAGPIGWGTAGVSILTSIWYAFRKKHKIQESQRDEIERIKRCTEALKELKGMITVISTQTYEICNNLNESFQDCTRMKNMDYTTLSDEQKLKLGTLVNQTKTLSVLLNKTVEG